MVGEVRDVYERRGICVSGSERGKGTMMNEEERAAGEREES